jgi:hypothetical protein
LRALKQENNPQNLINDLNEIKLKGLKIMRPQIKIRLIPTLCASLLLLSACGRLPEPTLEAEETLKSAKDQASKTVQSALDRAKSATDKASQTAQSTIDKTKSATDKATQSVSEAVTGVMTLKEGVQGMSTGVSNTLAAVNSGDFSTAQQEFSKVQGNWGKVGETVKSKSTQVYQQVDGHVSTIASLFKDPNPDRAKLVAELNALGKNLTNSGR